MQSIRIGWLFPSLMSTYGDRGNVICLYKRALWHGLHTEIIPVTAATSSAEMESIDLFVGGGAQDRQQCIAAALFRGEKGETLRKKIESGTPALFICASLQILGRSYQLSSGEQRSGLHLLDIETVYEGGERHTGPLIISITAEALTPSPLVYGFENHGSKTWLHGHSPLGKVISGHGNNGQDGTEGVFYRNLIGTYAHGPLLPKNPFLADWLLQQALLVKGEGALQIEPSKRGLLQELLEIERRARSRKCSGRR